MEKGHLYSQNDCDKTTITKDFVLNALGVRYLAIASLSREES